MINYKLRMQHKQNYVKVPSDSDQDTFHSDHVWHAQQMLVVPLLNITFLGQAQWQNVGGDTNGREWQGYVLRPCGNRGDLQNI